MKQLSKSVYSHCARKHTARPETVARHRAEHKSPYKKGNVLGSTASSKMKSEHRARRLRMYCIQIRLGQDINHKAVPQFDGILFCDGCGCKIDFNLEEIDRWLLRVEYIDGYWYCPECYASRDLSSGGMVTKTDVFGRVQRLPRNRGVEQMENTFAHLPGENRGTPTPAPKPSPEVGTSPGECGGSDVRGADRKRRPDARLSPLYVPDQELYGRDFGQDD